MNLNRFISTSEIRLVKLLWIEENQPKLENSDNLNNLENSLYLQKDSNDIYRSSSRIRTQKVYRTTPRIPLFYAEIIDNKITRVLENLYHVEVVQERY